MKLNNTTKKAQQLIENWERSPWYRSIWDCYEKPSRAKIDAYYECIEQMRNDNGDGGCITGFNTCTFTFAYKRTNKETGVVQLVYITPYNQYEIDL